MSNHARAVVNLTAFIGNVPATAKRLTMRTKSQAPTLLLDWPSSKVAATSPREQAEHFHATGKSWADGQGGEVTFIVQFMDEDDAVMVTTQFRVGDEDEEQPWEKGTPEGVITQLQSALGQSTKLLLDSTKAMTKAYGDIIEMQQHRIRDLEGAHRDLAAEHVQVVEAAAAADEEGDANYDRLVTMAERLIEKTIEKKLLGKGGASDPESNGSGETKGDTPPTDAPPDAPTTKQESE